MSPKFGVLINNLGTPSSPTPDSVGVYLREFLMDPYILSLPHLIRWFLVHLVIVPKRRFHSARNYQSIWTTAGSPLMTHSEALISKIRNAPALQNSVITLGMRYGHPSIESALLKLLQQGVQKVIFVPLYPQHADATSTSAIETFKKILNQYAPQKPYSILEPFFNKPFFINPVVKQIQEQEPFDHLLLSYHGLPIKQLSKKNMRCRGSGDCSFPFQVDKNGACYRAQCFETSRLIQEGLNLAPNQVTTSFQSRLGPVQWIQPYTSDVISELAHKGVKHLAVACPSFVSDCLETLEEIGIQARDQFLKAGGEKFTLIPCLNSDELWAQGLSEAIFQRGHYD